MKKLLLMLIISSPLLGQDYIKNKKLGDPGYGTHIFALITAVINTKGPILEMGCGDWSTQLLHVLCKKDKRYVLTVETEKNWMNLFNHLETSWHHFKFLPVYGEDNTLSENNAHPELWDNIGQGTKWAVVFVDHKPALRRAQDIQRLRTNTEIFVIHDTEIENDRYYDFEKVLSTFKYRYIYDKYLPHTTIVSDTIDVRNFFIDTK